MRTLHLFVAAGLVAAGLVTPAALGQTTVYQKFGDSAGDAFGYAVAGVGDVNGDGVSDFAVGAYLDDNTGTSSGSVRVYSGATGAVLHTFNGDAAGDNFGRSVAGAGDVNRDGFMDVIVGAPLNDNNGTDSGQAKVFSGQTGALLYSFNGPGPGARFGWSVSTAGDVNHDSHADVLIGAYNTQAGAWVHSGVNGQVLYSFNGDGCCDGFGWSVHGGGDVNRDGWPDFAIGAPFDDNNGSNSGMLRVHSGRDGSVILQVNGDAAGDQLGWSVAILGDVNGDTNADVAVGAPTNDAPFGDAGRVRVISGASLATLFVVDGLAAGDQLGYAVAPAGDVDGDGLPDLLVGAPFADPAGPSSGQMRVLSGLDGTVLALVRGASSDDQLGTSLQGVGDLTGDGKAELVVGSPNDDDFGSNSGSIRVVDAFLDCNANGVHDGLDIVEGTSQDCNGNSRPDECDVAEGSSADCNSNGVPDECDLSGGGGADCNGNGLLDECDIAFGASTDCDGNLVPDECQVPLPHFVDSSPVFPNLNGSVTHVHTVSTPPPAATDVTLGFTAVGDLDSSSEYVDVRLNGVHVGSVFTGFFSACVQVQHQLVVPRVTFDNLVAGGDAVFELDPTSSVVGCTNPSIRMTVDYDYFAPFDCNQNGLSDACDIVSGTSTDGNANGIPDECEFETYCVAAANSTGSPAQMFWGGSNSVSANDLLLIAFPLPPVVNGLFIYAAAPGYAPLGNGFLCLDPAAQGFINRLPFETSNASGTMTHALDVTTPPVPASLITSGSTWYFSCWFRDPPAGGAGFNFANGLRVLFVP